MLSLEQAHCAGDCCSGLEVGGGPLSAQPWCPSAVSGLQVMFSEEALPKGKGEYILGYYSNTSSSIAGVTEPFQVSKAKRQGWEGGGCRGGWLEEASCSVAPKPPVRISHQC